MIQINEKDTSKILPRFDEHEKILENKYNCNKCYLRSNYGIANIPIVVKTTHDYTANTNLYYSYKLDIQYTEVLTRYLENLINISETVCNNSLEKCINIKYDIITIIEALIKTSKKAQIKIQQIKNKDEEMIINNKINYYSVLYVLFKLEYYITNLQFNKIKNYDILVFNKNKIKTYIDNKKFDLVEIKKIETESTNFYNSINNDIQINNDIEINNDKKIIETFETFETFDNLLFNIILLIIILFLFIII